MQRLNIYLLLITLASPALAQVGQGLPDPTATIHAPKETSSRFSAKKSEKTTLYLQQTLVSPFRKRAIINGKSVKVGDSISGYRIVSISADQVIVRRGKQTKTLNMTSKRIQKRELR